MGRGRGIRAFTAAGLAGIVVVGSAVADAATHGPADAARASTPPKRLALGLRDHGRTFVVARTTNLSLTLGGPYRWRTPRAVGLPVDVQETVSDAPTAARTWELRPRRRGRAVLRSWGSPACTPATPECPSAGRAYAVTLVVR